ncbi:MAG: hypothetical protein AAF766_16520 [Cyanobacteria bacterium P01_D01_bin.14]
MPSIGCNRRLRSQSPSDVSAATREQPSIRTRSHPKNHLWDYSQRSDGLVSLAQGVKSEVQSTCITAY